MDRQETDNQSPKPVSSPERSPLRGLKSLRKPKVGGDGSTLSVSSADNGRGSLLRRSIDNGSRRSSKVRLDQPRSNASSDDGRRSSQGSISPTRRLSKFMRRRKKDRNIADSALTGPGVTHADATGADATIPEFHDWNNNHSSESVGQAKSIASSLLTDDSEPE